MKAALLLICLALGISVFGCSGISVSTDFNSNAVPAMAAYKTYGWLSATVDDDPRARSDIVHSRIQSAVERELLAKGYEKDMSGSPDFLVGYHVGLQGKMDVETVNSYYGYGYRGWGTETYVRQYTEGTLLLDIVDAASNELVWRGQAQAEVYEHSPPEERQARVDEAVRQMLAKFPPQ